MGSEFPQSEQSHRAGGVATWRDRAALGGLLLAAFVIALDFFLALVALPSIQRSLGSSTADLQLMVAAYAAAYAAGLVAAGRLGDMHGKRRMLQMGLVLFAAASMAAFLATSTTAMVVARCTQGLACAMLQPQVVGMLALRFGGDARGRSFAAYALSQATAGVLGQYTGGFIIGLDLAGWGWRACFLVALPIVVLASVLTQLGVEEHKASRAPSVDWLGMALGAGSLACLIWTLTAGINHAEWFEVLVGLAVAATLATAFGVQQTRLARRGGHPTLPMRLLGQRRVRSALACIFVFYLGLMSFYWLFSVRTQQELGLDAAKAGGLFAIYGVAFMLATMAGPAVSRRWKHEALSRGALILACAHLAGVVVALSGASLTWMGMALAFTGLGIGLLMAPLLALANASASPEDAGALAGTVGTAQSTANALGTALIPMAYVAAGAAQRDTTVSLGGSAGYAMSLLALAALALVLASLARRAARLH